MKKLRELDQRGRSSQAEHTQQVHRVWRADATGVLSQASDLHVLRGRTSRRRVLTKLRWRHTTHVSQLGYAADPPDSDAKAPKTGLAIPVWGALGSRWARFGSRALHLIWKGREANSEVGQMACHVVVTPRRLRRAASGSSATWASFKRRRTASRLIVV